MSKAPTDFYLEVSELGQGHAVYVHWSEGNEGQKRVVRSVEALDAFLQEAANKAGVERKALSVMCSSSIDFPEDTTKDKAVIKLCNEIRWGQGRVRKLVFPQTPIYRIYNPSDPTARGINLDDIDRVTCISAIPKGYWSDVIQLSIYSRLGRGGRTHEFHLSHSSGGRDGKQEPDDLQAESNFAVALQAMVELARHIRSQLP